MDTPDRRRERRRRFVAPVKVSERREGQWSNAVARDISARGMFIQTESDFSISESLLLRFRLSDSGDNLEVGGRVARVAGPGEVEQGAAGIGVEFVDVPDWVVSEIRRYVTEQSGGAIVEVIRKRET